MTGSVVKVEACGGVEPLFPTSPVYRPVVEEAQEITRRADELVETARTEAESIIEAARSQADEVRAAARADAMGEASDEMATLIEALRTSIGRAEESLDHDVVRLALALARRATGIELAIRPESFARFAEQQRTAAHRYDDVRIRCHPDHAVVVEGAGAAVEADATVPRGTVWVETELGAFVSSIEGAFDKLDRTIFGEDDA